MKCVIEKGQASAIREEAWETKDGRKGVSYLLCVKERTGDDEFDTVVTHELKIPDEDLAEVKSYVGKVVKVVGQIYTRHSKDKKVAFSNFVLDSIELV